MERGLTKRTSNKARGNGGRKKQPCPDPCKNSKAALLAKAYQTPKEGEKSIYNKQDDWEVVYIAKHTQLYALSPHGNSTPNFFVQKSQINKFPTAAAYNDAVQVAHKGNFKGVDRSMRTEMHKFVTTKGLCVAKSKALANSHISAGGAVQFYVTIEDKGKIRSTPTYLNLK